MGGGTIPPSTNISASVDFSTGTIPDTKSDLKKPDYGQANPKGRVASLKAQVRLDRRKKEIESKKTNELKKYLEEETKLLLSSPYTLLATYKRVMSNGAFYAGKMMEYFFGGDRGYYQLPYFFRHFDKFLKVCHQYDSTVLMYLPNVSPYDLLDPHPSAPSLLGSIETYFTGLDITLDEGSIGIQAKIDKNVKHIQAIFDFCINDFMVDSRDADQHFSSVSPASSNGSTSPASSNGSTSPASSTSSSISPDKIASFFLGPLEKSLSPSKDRPYIDPKEREIQRKMGLQIHKERVRSTSISPNTYRQGGALSIKNHNPTYKKKTSKPNKKSRKYIKSKRLMKSKVTKPRTYKRRATGGKRKSKPNKTMRRYRRVRK